MIKSLLYRLSKHMPRYLSFNKNNVYFVKAKRRNPLKYLTDLFGLWVGQKVKIKIFIKINNNNVDYLKKQWVYEKYPYDNQQRVSLCLGALPEIRDWKDKKTITVEFEGKRCLSESGKYTINFGYLEQGSILLEGVIFTANVYHTDSINHAIVIVVLNILVTAVVAYLLG